MKILIFVLFSLCVVLGGDRYNQKMVVLMVLNTKTTKVNIKNKTMFVWNDKDNLDTSNIIECAEISGCSKVLFFNKSRNMVVKISNAQNR